MKRYRSLNEAKKSLATQVLVLTVCVLLIAVSGRFLIQPRFDNALILSYDDQEPISEGEITIQLEKKDVPVSEDIHDQTPETDEEPVPVQEPEYELVETVGASVHAKVLQIDMLPDKAGQYAMTVLDRTGAIILKDEIFVDKFHTAYSKKTGSFTGDEALVLAGILYYIGLCLIMMVFYHRLDGPLAYSYEAILSCGVLVFSLVALIIEVPAYINHLRMPGLYSTWQMINDFAAGGMYFTIFTAPLVVFFCILLIISNIELLRHERPRLQNGLGLLLGFLLLAGEGIYYVMYSNFGRIPSDQHLIACTVINIIGITFTYAECILFSSMINGFRAATHIPASDRDYILILGCGFRPDGTLPPLLRGRVDKAMEFWYKQKEETGKKAVIIPSGGQGPNESMAEAQAMYQYMVSSGFPEECIVREDKSVNTYQNMEFSRKIIESSHPDSSDANTAFVTTNYHVFRSGVWAGLAGLEAEGLGSDTKWWFWPNAFVRECVGLLQKRLVPEIIYLIILIGIFSIITWLSYL